MFGFGEIIGHDSVKEHLRNSISSDQISHAYIINGPEGSGKKMLADRFAAALCCEDEVGKPCGMCISCMQAESHNHPDIIYVTHEKANIVVSDIRSQLINDISIKPYQASHKVYIVPEAEKMNEAAQNALLKTLEEPPEYAVILLLANGTGAFLQTILSRCVVLNLRPVSQELVTRFLMDSRQLPDYAASVLASFSDGCIGKALQYASDDSFSELRSTVLSLVKGVSSMKQAEISDLASKLCSKDTKFSFERFTDLLLLWYHDVLAVKSTGNIRHVLFLDETNELTAQAKRYSFEKLNNIIGSIAVLKQRYSENTAPDISLEMFIMGLKY